MLTTNRKQGSVIPFLVGAGVGAVAALLFAPKAGEQLRGDIADGVNEGGRKIRTHGRELKERAQKAVSDVQEQAKEALDAGQDAYSRAKNT